MPGDLVVYRKGAGMNIVLNGYKYVILVEEDVLMAFSREAVPACV